MVEAIRTLGWELRNGAAVESAIVLIPHRLQSRDAALAMARFLPLDSAVRVNAEKWTLIGMDEKWQVTNDDERETYEASYIQTFYGSERKKP